MKRSELKRTPFKPKESTGLLRVAAVQKTRAKKCKQCRQPFVPRNLMARACSPGCAVLLAVNERMARERKQDRERKQAMKTRSQWLRETQQAFNALVREEDRLAGHACISSGLPLDWTGNNVDAGHYRSVGSAPHLRFTRDNCHAQSKKENRYASGNAVDYRVGLIARIGFARVEALEADQEPRKWTVDELKAMRDDFRRQLKALKEN